MSEKPSIKPVKVNVESYHLNITWADGHQSVYPMRYLRQYCRCADCVNELTGEETLDKASVAETLRCAKAEPMGHYAIALAFSDLHRSGIYSYEYLRHLCPCDICQKG